MSSPAKYAADFWGGGGSQVFRVEPYGVVASEDHGRPILLFRREGSEDVVPVWLSPIEAGITVAQQSHQGTAQSPHDLSLKILGELKQTIVGCLLDEVRGHHQFVEVLIKGPRQLRTLKCRAEQAISLCLQASVEFYCRSRFMSESRETNSQLMRAQNDLKLDKKIGRNSQRYMM